MAWSLVLLGLLGFAIPYFTTQQTKDVAKVGDLKVQTTESTSAIPPLVGGGALVPWCDLGRRRLLSEVLATSDNKPVILSWLRCCSDWP